MVRDFGAGLTIDELIGMQAGDIAALTMPNEKNFEQLKATASNLVNHDYEAYQLMELWGSGETVWMGEINMMWSWFHPPARSCRIEAELAIAGDQGEQVVSVFRWEPGQAVIDQPFDLWHIGDG